MTDYVPTKPYLYYYRYVNGRKYYYTVIGEKIAKGKIPKNIVNDVEEYPPILDYNDNLNMYNICKKNVEDTESKISELYEILKKLEKDANRIAKKYGKCIDFPVDLNIVSDPRYYYYETVDGKKTYYDYRKYISIKDVSMTQTFFRVNIVNLNQRPTKGTVKLKNIKNILDKIYPCQKKYLIISKKAQIIKFQSKLHTYNLTLIQLQRELNVYSKTIDGLKDRLGDRSYEDVYKEMRARMDEYIRLKPKKYDRFEDYFYSQFFGSFFGGGYQSYPRAKTQDELRAESTKFLNEMNLFERKDYLRWIVKGGHPDKGGDPEIFKTVTSHATKLGWVNNHNGMV